jgi:hypothetical protein
MIKGLLIWDGLAWLTGLTNFFHVIQRFQDLK